MSTGKAIDQQTVKALSWQLLYGNYRSKLGADGWKNMAETVGAPDFRTMDPDENCPMKPLNDAVIYIDRVLGKGDGRMIREVTRASVDRWASMFKNLVEQLPGRPQKMLEIFCTEVHPYFLNDGEASTIVESTPDHLVMRLDNGLLEDFKVGLIEGFCQIVGAKADVRKMGDELRVESTPGVGSRFYFTLPLVVGTGPETSAAGVRAPLVPVDAKLAPGDELMAMVVDDSTANRRILGGLLESAGVRVITAGGGLEALEGHADPHPRRPGLRPGQPALPLHHAEGGLHPEGDAGPGRGRLGEGEHQVEILNRLTGCAFDEIVDCAHNDEPPGARIHPPRDFYYVGSGDVFGIGQFPAFQEAHERFVSVALAIATHNLLAEGGGFGLAGEVFRGREIEGRQDASIDGNQMRGELDDDGLTGR